MATPRLNVHLNKGRHGVSLEKLGAIARETALFLTKLSVDLGDPESTENWIAEDFSSQSVLFKVRRERPSRIEPEVWDRAFHAVIGNDFADPIMNVRITPETREQFWKITNPIEEHDSLSLGIENGAPEVEWFEITKEMALTATSTRPNYFTSYGEVQGYVHALYKEAQRPKIIIRELSTQNLVHCFFAPAQYDGIVALLDDKDAVVFVEGDVKEDPATGFITEIDVKDFTPAPAFDERDFEDLIGAFPDLKTDGSES